MTLTAVAPDSTDIKHLASVDVKFSGAHIGGGIFFSANHFPSVGDSYTAEPQDGLDTATTPHSATDYDFTLPADSALWADYNDINPDTGAVIALKAGFDISLEVGGIVPGTGTFYDGPSVSLLIANDPNDLSGTATVTGYPAVPVTGASPGDLHQSTTSMPSGSYFEQDVDGDVGGFFQVSGLTATNGMSGGPLYLETDLNSDSTDETYIIGALSRAGVVMGTPLVQATSFSPFYDDLARVIQGLSGAEARTADDFGRMALLSAQTAGSTLTTVQGQFFHEDLFGGINADTLLGAGGNDALFGRGGADNLQGGTGNDTLDGGAGADALSGGTGADWFVNFGGAADVVSDFEASEGDIIDLASHFATFDDVLAVATEGLDGSVMIPLPAGGSVQVLDTSLSDLNAVNLNIVCFARGTRITTEHGPVAVEDLHVGMRLLTQSGAYEPLRALRVRHLGPQEARQRPNLWPIRFEADFFGPGLPAAPLYVSRQHRMFINSDLAQRVENEPVLVPAKDFLDCPGASCCAPEQPLSYYHLELANHAILQAENCWSESFFSGPQSQSALPASVHMLRPMTPAARFLKGQAARKLIARHIKNGRAFQHAARATQTPPQRATR